MELRLERYEFSPRTTIGDLFIGDVFECATLEDFLPEPYAKTPGRTCIPPGRYEVVITHSPRFGVEMPLLLDVPGFEGVRIHTGNTDRDTAGCILVGTDCEPDKLLHSRVAYEALFRKLLAALIRGERIFLTIHAVSKGATA